MVNIKRNIPTDAPLYITILFNKYSTDYDTQNSYTIVMDQDDYNLLQNEDEKQLLMYVLMKDYICIRMKGYIEAVSYRCTNYPLPVIGEEYIRSGNVQTSFSEGLYSFLYDPDEDYNYIEHNNIYKVPILFAGYVEYWKCVASNDEPKDKEILIRTPIKTIKYLGGFKL